VFQDGFDGSLIRYLADNPHSSLTFWTDEGIDFVDLPNQIFFLAPVKTIDSKKTNLMCYEAGDSWHKEVLIPILSNRQDLIREVSLYFLDTLDFLYFPGH